MKIIPLELLDYLVEIAKHNEKNKRSEDTEEGVIDRLIEGLINLVLDEAGITDIPRRYYKFDMLSEIMPEDDMTEIAKHLFE